MINCSHCGSTDVHRVSRKGITDDIRTAFNRWPYRCERCRRRFHATGRYQQQRSDSSQPNRATHESKPGPEMAFRKSDIRPAAQVVISADSHEQLDRILLALDRAVNSYQQASHAQQQRAASASR